MPEVFSLTIGKKRKQWSASQLTFVVLLFNIVIPKDKKTSGAQGNSLHTLTKPNTVKALYDANANNSHCRGTKCMLRYFQII